MRTHARSLGFGLTMAIAFVFLTATSAFATNWSVAKHTDRDCAGHGCIDFWYRTDTSDSTGYKLESLTIAAKSQDDTGYYAIDGKGVSCWNDSGVVKWSRDGSQTNLNPGNIRVWNMDVNMPDSTSLTCSFLFNEKYASSGFGINNCAKIRLKRGDPEQDGFCSYNGKSIRWPHLMHSIGMR